MKCFHFLDTVIYASSIISIIFLSFLLENFYLLVFLPFFLFAMLHSLFSHKYFKDGKRYIIAKYSDLSWIDIKFEYDNEMKLTYKKLCEGNWILKVGKFRLEKYKLPF